MGKSVDMLVAQTATYAQGSGIWDNDYADKFKSEASSIDVLDMLNDVCSDAIFYQKDQRLAIDERYRNNRAISSISKRLGISSAMVNYYIKDFKENLVYRWKAIIDVYNKGYALSTSIYGLFRVNLGYLTTLSDSGYTTIESVIGSGMGVDEFLNSNDIVSRIAEIVNKIDSDDPCSGRLDKMLASKRYNRASVVSGNLSIQPFGGVKSNIPQQLSLNLDYTEKDSEVSSEVVNKNMNSSPKVAIKDSSKSTFVIIKEYTKGVYGFDLDDLSCKCRFVSSKSLKAKYQNTISISDIIAPLLNGRDMPSRKLFSGELEKSVNGLGINNLSDLPNVRGSALASKGVSKEYISLLSEELHFRGMGKLKDELPQAVEYNGVTYHPIEAMDSMPLPASFLPFAKMEGLGSTATSDEILDAYSRYLDVSGRSSEIPILEKLREEFSTGIIRFMEEESHCKYTFNLIELTLSDYKLCYEVYRSSLTSSLSSELSRTKYSELCKSILQSVGTVDLVDVHKFCSRIEIDIPMDNLLFIYQNLKNMSLYMLRKPKVSTGYKSGVSKLGSSLAKKDRSLKGLSSAIDDVCSRYNLPYDYAMNGVSSLLNSSMYKIQKELGYDKCLWDLLINLCCFDFNVVSCILDMYPDYLKKYNRSI